ncbi:MAG: phospholipase [Myxococcales bacterium]
MKLHHLELAPRTQPQSGTLVLLHGYGADERDLLSLAHELDPSLRAVGLQGPHALGGTQRAWFNLQQTPQGFAFDPAEVEDALALAIAAVEEIARHDAAPPLLLGFSQGAAMALSIALLRPELARGVLSLSGVPPSLAEERFAPAAALRNLPVFAAHGLYDPIIPVELGRMVRGALTEKGLAVEWHEYAMGHQVSEQELADAASWLSGLRKRS